MSGIYTEQHLESEERGNRNLHKAIFLDITQNVNACFSMMNIFDGVFEMINKNRHMPLLGPEG